jgi:hypothetical protein
MYKPHLKGALSFIFLEKPHQFLRKQSVRKMRESCDSFVIFEAGYWH